MNNLQISILLESQFKGNIFQPITEQVISEQFSNWLKYIAFELAFQQNRNL
jgi:hypothetical protein